MNILHDTCPLYRCSCIKCWQQNHLLQVVCIPYLQSSKILNPQSERNNYCTKNYQFAEISTMSGENTYYSQSVIIHTSRLIVVHTSRPIIVHTSQPIIANLLRQPFLHCSINVYRTVAQYLKKSYETIVMSYGLHCTL